MSNRVDKPNTMKTRHPSLEMQDPEVVKKKQHQDMLTRAKNKLFNLSDALRTNKILNGESDGKKAKSQSTLDYLFKSCPNKNEKNQVYANSRMGERRASSLQKQNSVGSYPVKTETSEEELDTLGGLPSRPEPRETAALALERPRKKLSFREPEISGYAVQTFKKGAKKSHHVPEFKRSISAHNGSMRDGSSWEDLQLESQAMRVVRTVGQAFEVCHKLSINGPDPDHQDQDEQETLTQDLVSDRVSDIVSDKPKKDLLSETISDRNSLQIEENLLDDFNCPESLKNESTFLCNKRNFTSGETYVSPLGDALLTGGSGSGSMGNTTVFSTGSTTLSAQHEIQLLKEQLEQQTQQTQAALAQLQLVREQLAAEQSARMEAQARTHQLLVHNKELLDHIAALVSHLQGGEKGSAQSHPGPHVAMPQQQQNQPGEGYHQEQRSDSASADQSPVLQALGLQPQGLIENRMVTNCLPPSPLRTSFNPSGSVFNFPYPQETPLEGLFQRLQAFGGYQPPQYTPYFQQLVQPNLYNPPLLNSTYSLQPPPQKKLPTSPLMMQTYTGSPVLERRISPGRGEFQEQPLRSTPQQSPQTQQVPQCSPSTQSREPQFIKPLSQLGTLTTTDVQGRVRVIVPVPSRSPDDDAGNLLASLRLGDELRPNITRSTSEKVPNRSELMSQVQRTAWARHTTK